MLDDFGMELLRLPVALMSFVNFEWTSSPGKLLDNDDLPFADKSWFDATRLTILTYKTGVVLQDARFSSKQMPNI